MVGNAGDNLVRTTNQGNPGRVARAKRLIARKRDLGYFVSSASAIRQRTETQAEQALLFQAIGVPGSPRFFQIDPRTKRVVTTRSAPHDEPGQYL